MAQCVANAMVSSRSNDQQSKQFSAVIASRAAAGKSLRVLDYASGKGRFARALGDLSSDDRRRIDYFTFDDPQHDEDVGERRRNVASLYPDEGERSAARCSNEISDYFNEKRTDVVVMANFLHEVLPSDWADHLANAYKALADDGTLLIFEDTAMSVGELPTKTGFIVLTLPDLRVLFGTNDGIDVADVADPRCSVLVVAKRTLQAALRAEAHEWYGRLRETLGAVLQRSTREIMTLRAAERRDVGPECHERWLRQHPSAANVWSHLGRGSRPRRA